MLAFFLAWLLQFPSAWLHPKNAGPLLVVKSVLSPAAYLLTMIWALVAFRGVKLNLGAKTVFGGELGWSFMKSINTVVSGVIPPMVNIADLARYANRPKDVTPLIAGLFVSKSFCFLIGLFTTAAGAKRFGVANWNLWDFYALVLENDWSPSTRALVFLGAFIQAGATIVIHISSNAIPVGCDLTGLFPRYFTIVRGQVLCNLLIWAVVPWLLVSSAQSFISFLGSYLCFISPILGCMIVDYWVVRRGNIHVPSLYRPEPGSPYFYTKSFNLRAYIAWAAVVVLVISGISGSINPGSVSQTAVNMYNCGFVLSFTAGAVVYYVVCKLFPPKIYPIGEHEQESTNWESLVPTEGFFHDDEPMAEYIKEKVEIGGTPSLIIEPNDEMAKKVSSLEQSLRRRAVY